MEKVIEKEKIRISNGKRVVNDLIGKLNQKKLSMGKDWDHTPWSNDSWTDSHRKN